MLNVIDLFSGVGGLSLGFRQAGFSITVANEIDSEIAHSYKKNHPNTETINEDITKLLVEDVFSSYLGDTLVVIGGPPCQGFSQKGRRKTINDERNFLFRHFFKVVSYLKPKYFLMENVPNLLTTENGLFKQEISELYKAVGYSVDFGVLNAADFGVPQNRKRAFILGKLGDVVCELPKTNNTRTTIKEAIGDLAYLNSGEGQEVQSYFMPPQSEYQQKLRQNSDQLYNHVSTKHSKTAIEKMALVPPGMGKEVLPVHMLTKSIYSGTWSRMIEDDTAVTITTRFDTPSSGRFVHPTLNRCITPREAARIQSFPDDFIFYGSKSSQMKQIGNAVPPMLARAIAEKILSDNKNDGGQS